MTKFLQVNSVLLTALAAALHPAAAAAPDAASLEFFEKRIRPLLVDHCYECHSATSKKLKGGLLLDTRAGLLKGGDNGPAVVPGDVEKSLLIKAVRYTDKDLAMPPKDKKLPPERIADLEAWVKMGAPDPRTGSGQAVTINAARHWAFQPVSSPAPPMVKNKTWGRSPIDAFILEKLEIKKISASPVAAQRTLIRRATFDLTGLPPTPEEVAAFESDPSPDAFAKVVDRLLASPRYGERWGRFWLDVARYADTKGYVFEEERRYAFAWTYRDWVIRAFNEDLPYDQFIAQQIAADLLPLGEDKRPLAALGFLTLGRRFLNNQPDIIDDRIDVVSRGTMGLTVACARCHDHKYDPIPTRDYYSLYGVFASCNEPTEKPLLGGPPQSKDYPAYLAEKKKREDELNTYRNGKEKEVLSTARARAGDYLLAEHDTKKLGDKGKKESLARERKLDPRLTERWRKNLEDWSKQPHPVFAPWFAFAALPETNFTASAKDLAASFAANAGEKNNRLVARAFAGAAPASLKEVAGRYNKLFGDADKTATGGTPDQEALRKILYADDSPYRLTPGEVDKLFDVPSIQKVRALRRKLEELDATHAGAPARAMVLLDNAKPNQPRVFKRGNPGTPGDEVPRQFLQVIAGEKRQPFQKGSGRLEMAQAIVSTNNPLTARVLVNRVWRYHFGQGLVRTPSDFGLRSDPPTHPELLDFLATRFMADGWSVKKLHRLMMLSSVYQQADVDNAAAAKLDPGNDLLWRMNRRRLEFESLRDTLLAVSGKIDFTAGGPSTELTTEPFTARRTVYGYIERQNLPGLFRTFDFASPDATSPQRFTTTVPQQALFLMNSPFVVQLVKSFLERLDVKTLSEDQRITRLYQLAYQRAPEPDELQLAKQFLSQPAATVAAETGKPAWQYGQGQFDETLRRVTNFKALPHFTGTAWQGGAKLPDTKTGWVMLNAAGGHPGGKADQAAIRRWTAPRDGTIAITAKLNHSSTNSDGIRARIVSSRTGPAGEWIAKNQTVETKAERLEVKAGDTVDFGVDCRANETSDSFTWAPKISYLTPAPKETAGGANEWNAKTDFAGPPPPPVKSLTPWEKYAQVLLLANELVFVD